MAGLKLALSMLAMACTILAAAASASGINSNGAGASSSDSGSDSTMSAYDLLEQNGFPGGLLPNNVQSYSLDSNSGSFVLYLSSRCDVTIPGEYPVRYEKKISGKLSQGSIRDLSGVYVKVLLVWWELTGIEMNGNKVVFEVGLLSASYPATNFDESPDCGSNIALY